MPFWKKKFDAEAADEIAALTADFFKKSVAALTKKDRSRTDVDVSFTYAFGVIDILAQVKHMGDTESVGKITMLFLAKHLGIAPEASYEQMVQMMKFSQSKAGLEIMGQGANAFLRFFKGDHTAGSHLNDLLSGDYFKSS